MQGLIHGKVMHHRLYPKDHRFNYSVPYVCLDVRALDSCPSFWPLFAVDKFALFSVRNEDYLFNQNGSNLIERVEQQLHQAGIRDDFTDITLITTPRFLNYVFNPVSFIVGRKPDGSVGALISQVNNTFGETHVYVAKDPTYTNSGKYAKFSRDKVFHVSPFNEVKGIYDFLVRAEDNKIEVRINLLEEQGGLMRVKFRSYVKGELMPMSGKSWLRLWKSYPIGGSAAIPLIMYEAAKLYFKRRLPVFAKPIAESSMTVKKAPATSAEKIYEKLVLGFLGRIKTGQLRLEIDGDVYMFGDRSSAPATLVVKNRALFKDMVFGGDVAFGEGYVKGYWNSPDLVAVLRILAANMASIGNGEPGIAKFLRPFRAIGHWMRHNSKANAKQNISAHYDLSNDFFAEFLDESMSYSCALYRSEKDTLKTAQLNKIDALLDRLALSQEHHLLEIGTGWGALAIRAVERFGCRVTSVTLSKEQLAKAQERVLAAGLEEKIDIKYCDYRDIEGQYDRIISVEMLEAVGHRYYPAFFNKLESLLAKDGLVALQTITIPDQRYDSYKNGCDWIQKYIFPGGLCPSVSVLTETMTKHSSLIVEELENIGVHYAKTLKEWRQRFLLNWGSIQDASSGKFDERFKRMWLYYLSYCEAGFAERLLGTHHLLLSRAQNLSLDYAPGYIEAEANEESLMAG